MLIWSVHRFACLFDYHTYFLGSVLGWPYFLGSVYFISALLLVIACNQIAIWALLFALFFDLKLPKD